MKPKSRSFAHRIHLIISIAVVIPAAIIYGFFPESVLEITPNTIDESNFHKAIMGLYLGFSIIWLLGILKEGYLKIALVSNIIFMLGLGSGRVLSILLDGMPSIAYSLGTIGELTLGIYGLYVYRQIRQVF